MIDASVHSRTISAVIPVSSRYDAPEALYREYRDALTRLGGTLEFVTSWMGRSRRFMRR